MHMSIDSIKSIPQKKKKKTVSRVAIHVSTLSLIKRFEIREEREQEEYVLVSIFKV